MNLCCIYRTCSALFSSILCECVCVCVSYTSTVVIQTRLNLCERLGSFRWHNKLFQLKMKMHLIIVSHAGAIHTHTRARAFETWQTEGMRLSKWAMSITIRHTHRRAGVGSLIRSIQDLLHTFGYFEMIYMWTPSNLIYIYRFYPINANVWNSIINRFHHHAAFAISDHHYFLLTTIKWKYTGTLWINEIWVRI